MGELSRLHYRTAVQGGEREVGTEERCAAVQFQEGAQLTEKSLSPCHPSEECWG